MEAVTNCVITGYLKWLPEIKKTHDLTRKQVKAAVKEGIEYLDNPDPDNPAKNGDRKTSKELIIKAARRIKLPEEEFKDLLKI